MNTRSHCFHLEHSILVPILMLLLIFMPLVWGRADIYVAEEGRIDADGSLDNPYGSLHQAVESVRELRGTGYSDPVNIILREGRHQVNQTLVLGLHDGNPAGSIPTQIGEYGAGNVLNASYLTFAAYPGEHPVVSGGVLVTGWKKLDDAPPGLQPEAAGHVWIADIPEGMGIFHTLYDSKGRLKRARINGFSPTRKGDRRTLHFPEGALKNWNNLEDVEIQVRPFRPWVINMLPLASVDESTGIAKTAVSATYDIDKLPAWVHNPSGATIWTENILEALDEPGEWVVNTKTGKIYIWPRNPASDGSPQEILAPTTSELIRVEGDIDYAGPTDRAVRGIHFDGLTFSHADRCAWKNDENRLGWGMQHDWDMFDRPTAMLRFRGAEDCVVTNCLFTHSGGSGLRMDLHAQRNRVSGSEFSYLGEAGIILAGYGFGTKDANHHNSLINNYIHHFSEITWHSPGIWAWQSGHNHIAHNELSHSGYAAVLITNRVEPDRGVNGEGGKTVRHHEIPREIIENTEETYENWKIREPYNHARHNLLEYNEITHCVQLLSDGNAIYVSGAGTGNIVRYNYIHDNFEHSLPAAIRCDDDQHETLIYGNVIANSFGFSAGIASKGVNDIINNFIFAPRSVPKSGYFSFEWVSVKDSNVHHNIIVSHPDGGRAHNERLHGRADPYDGVPLLSETCMDSNLYYHPTDSDWVDAHLTRMRAVGNEMKSMFGDPGFVDPKKGDFSFRPGSPALAMGIEPLDVSRMGRLNPSNTRKPERLELSDGSLFVTPEFYPEFNWDTTPMYYMFGDGNRVLLPEEVEFIAERTDFLCIEKSHGLKELGAAELGAKHEAAAFKKIKPDMKVLFYFNSAWAWPFTSYNKAFTKDKIDRYPGLKRFLLIDPETGELNRRGSTYSFDVLNPDFRRWWVDTVAKGVEESGCDGAFIDQMHGFSWLREDRSEAVRIAQGELMTALKQKLGPDKILLGNNAHVDNAKYVFPAIDANMFEHYSDTLLSKEKLLKDWQDMLRISKAGKMSVFRVGVEVESDEKDGAKERKSKENRHQRLADLSTERLEYYLACYLIGAQPYSYFQYGWGWTLASGSLLDFPELNKPLGPPKGPYRRLSADGWEFTREFEHASVWVNTELGEAKINWME